MFQDYSFTASERFMRYVQVDTQSNPQSQSQPSTEKQKNLSRILVEELNAMGAADVELDEHGYVYATIPSNTDKDVPVICFCSHVDTAPDASGTGVKPLLHRNYTGADIVLPDDNAIVISPKDFPYLEQLKGHDLITASGTTLLGADDKAGVAEIMDAAHYLLTHPGVKHGAIRILFTPDEEVGRGTAKVDMQKLGARFGYTLDGGEAGSLEDETFSADAVSIVINGVITHPGYAKDKLVNALKIGGEVLARLPKTELSPETTDGKQGFVHPVRFEGIAERCTLEFIIRDFDTALLKAKEDFLQELTALVVQSYPGASFEFVVTEQYRNMKEVLDQHPEVVANAKEAIRRAGLELRMESIRGGTDGSRLSFMGLPCPNLFAGMQGIHSMKEFVSVQDMNKAVETIVHLCSIWAEA
ncbi:peptidase T [Flaviaesturariibacter aridisoli]|uniref:Peptidase T n=1 Tax=Flaviaesturariibacter aridisoli TaxID=2545761 RepID=A0A4R4E9E1_9BACT|nr:peptidase T [Flaviaesturariibacter aridisoli]TCZ74458.1 peptidase T [Flaviaesturariibacter aridisoli]